MSQLRGKLINRMLDTNGNGTGTKDASGLYGNNISLTGEQGIQIICSVDGTESSHVDNFIIKTNTQWNLLAGVDTALSDYGTGDAHLNVRYSINRFSNGLVLKGDAGDKFIVRLLGNFSGLTSQYFMVQGYYEKYNY